MLRITNKIIIILSVIIYFTPCVLQSTPTINTPLNEKLLKAVIRNDTKLTKILLKQGADPNTRGDNATTILMIAAQNNNAKLVEILLHAKADPNATSISGHTALMDSAEQTSPAVTQALIDHKADVNAVSLFGTPLSFAAKKVSSSTDHITQQRINQTIKILLQNGANPNISTPHGGTPLSAACGANNINTVKLLLQYNIDTKNPHNQYALIAAAKAGNLEIFKILLQKGFTINITQKHLMGTIFFGNDVISAAKKSGNQDLINFIEHYTPIPCNTNNNKTCSCLSCAIINTGD